MPPAPPMAPKRSQAPPTRPSPTAAPPIEAATTPPMTPSNPPDDAIEVTAVPVSDTVPGTAIVGPQAAIAEPTATAVAVPDEEPGGAMTFFEHLTELRKRLINSLAALAIGAFIGVSLSKYLIDYVTRPIVKALKAAGQAGHLYYTHPAGYLNLYITLGVYLGI